MLFGISGDIGFQIIRKMFTYSSIADEKLHIPPNQKNDLLKRPLRRSAQRYIVLFVFAKLTVFGVFKICYVWKRSNPEEAILSSSHNGFCYILFEYITCDKVCYFPINWRFCPFFKVFALHFQKYC